MSVAVREAPAPPVKKFRRLTKQEVIRRQLDRMNDTERNRLSLLATPRLVMPYIRHTPHPTQQVFLSLSKYREVLFGGAAGGGKSDALLMAALQYVDVPGYAALILRRTWPDLVLPGAIMDRAEQWLTGTPAVKRDGGRLWVFPSGAKLQFGYLQHDKSKYRYQSAEFQYVGFDELTQFPEEATYQYLFSRTRRPALVCLSCSEAVGRYKEYYPDSGLKVTKYKHTSKMGKTKCRRLIPDPTVLSQYPEASDGTCIFDVPLRVRSGTNPGGVGAEWVKRRLVDVDTRRKGTIFVPSLLRDNPSLDADTYRESLSYLNEVDRARLEDGDWDITEAGEMFDRGDFVYVNTVPGNVVEWVRFWDNAATENSTSDWTVGALVGVTSNMDVIIGDIVRFKGHPKKVEDKKLATARFDGQEVAIREEQEPGSAGVTVIAHNRTKLMGYDYDGIRSSGDKPTRARALASAVKGHKVLVLARPWTADLVKEFEVFPNKGMHDDQVDAVSGAFNELMFGKRARLLN